jgi:cyclic lactone autoinducer peptide
VKKAIMSCGTLLAALALFIGTTSVNAPSLIFYHQPRIPAEMKRFKK